MSRAFDMLTLVCIDQAELIHIFELRLHLSLTFLSVSLVLILIDIRPSLILRVYELLDHLASCYCSSLRLQGILTLQISSVHRLQIQSLS